MSEYKYPSIKVIKKDGSEKFLNAEINETLANYWAWAHSEYCALLIF